VVCSQSLGLPGVLLTSMAQGCYSLIYTAQLWSYFAANHDLDLRFLARLLRLIPGDFGQMLVHGGGSMLSLGFEMFQARLVQTVMAMCV
jgi:hypothetical protein